MPVKRGVSTKVSINTGVDTVAVVPVLGELTGESLEQMRDEVGQANPGQHEQSGVVDDSVEVAFAGLGPANR